MSEKEKRDANLLEKIVSLCKRRGFIYPGSEIYGGLAGTYDYGPLGVALKNNLKNLWWKNFVSNREDMYGLDAAIIMNPKTWEASGHVAGFADPLIGCLTCSEKFRTDHLIDTKAFNEYRLNLVREHWREIMDVSEKMVTETEGNKEYLSKVESAIKVLEQNNLPKDIEEIMASALKAHMLASVSKARKNLKDLVAEIKPSAAPEGFSETKNFSGHLTQLFLAENKIKCPNCGSIEWNVPSQFNMMLKTNVGVVDDLSSTTYLRPETAQGMFVNFKNIIDSFHPKLPFGLAQIGKAFRNEIAPRDFLFRTREFEQMEVEYFVKAEDWQKYFEEWRVLIQNYFAEIGLDSSHVHELEVPDGDRAHYSARTIDFEFDFSFGKKELSGLAYRSDYDLKQHQEFSKQDLTYFDEESKTRFLPHVIEPSLGLDRILLAVLTDAYTEDELGGEARTYLKLNKNIAPVRLAIFPLLKNKPDLVNKAREVYQNLKVQMPHQTVVFDDNGNIGKRYRRQDEIGTPHCITIDFDTLGEGGEDKKDTVTVRDRDTGEQERVKISELTSKL
ncbi:MAG: glycine--tRNA ligase [Patescibacteria group bacterium]